MFHLWFVFGVVYIAYMVYKPFRFPFSPFRFNPPPPLRSSRLSQGAKRVFRRSTGCASVPSEGSNFHCDVGRLAGAVVVVRFLFVTNSPPETGASTP